MKLSDGNKGDRLNIRKIGKESQRKEYKICIQVDKIKLQVARFVKTKVSGA